MPSAKHERLYEKPSVGKSLKQKVEEKSASEQEKEAMAAEGGFINDSSGKETEKVRKRLGY